MSLTKRFKFSASKINNLPPNPPESKSTELELSDTETIGLKCLVGKTGSKRFLLRYTSPITKRKSSIALARWPDLSIEAVRKKARNLKEQIADGIDPKLERDNHVIDVIPTVYEFFHQTYLPLAKKKKITWSDDVARFQHCSSIHNLPFDKLTANHLLKIQLTMGETENKRRNGTYAVATINRVIALMKTVCRLAYRMLDIVSVGDKVSLFPEDNVRTRYLTLDETRRLIDVARQYPCISSGCLIAMLFLTGCRSSELRLRRWSEFDYVKRTLFIPRTKNGSSHTVYLSDLMLEILQSIPRQKNNPYIFSGHKYARPISMSRRAFKLIKLEASIPNPDELVIHCARHTVGSLLVSNGVPLTQIQKQLNHKDLSSTQRYSKLSEDKQRETASYLSEMIMNDGAMHKPGLKR